MVRQIKDYTVYLWNKVQRRGVDDLLKLLETSNYYSSPASIGKHLSIRGGLAMHQLNVYYAMRLIANSFMVELDEEERIVVALGHDLCKIDRYVLDEEPCTDAQYTYFKDLRSKLSFSLYGQLASKGYQRPDFKPTKEHAKGLIGWMKAGVDTPIPEDTECWTYTDDLPLGHGEKSLYVLSTLIPVKPNEAMAIRWHMGGYDIAATSGTSKYDYQAAQKQTSLTTLVQLADIAATNLLETEYKEETRG